jgi:hypothetical protein
VLALGVEGVLEVQVVGGRVFVSLESVDALNAHKVPATEATPTGSTATAG